MKRLLAVLFITLSIAGVASAFDFYLGANAHFASAIQPAEVREARPSGLAPSDFAFGGETRLYLNAITGSASAIFLPGSSFQAPRFRVMTDVGLSLQLAILRAGIGIGPDFGIAFGESTETARLGGNLRLTGDIVLGDLSLGLSWYSLISFNRESIAEAFRNPYGFLGISLLKRL